LAGCLFAGAATADPTQEWRATINSGDWIFQTNGDGVSAYYRDPDRTKTPRRQWERYEYEAPQGAYRYKSAIQLAEYDCHGQMRVLDIVYYSDNNVAGPITRFESPKAGWSNVIPGTVSEQMGIGACEPDLWTVLRGAPPSHKRKHRPATSVLDDEGFGAPIKH
jgi:hypothetical protein